MKNGKRRTWRKSERSEAFVARLEVKERDESRRTFRGSLSTSHLDLGDGQARDIVHPGAFARWLDHFGKAAEPYVPLLDSHSRWSIFDVLGHMLDGDEKLTGQTLRYELEGGEVLEVDEMLLDTEWQVIDGDDGERVLDRMRPGSVRKMSMGYEPLDWDVATLVDGVKLRNLREVRVEEGSLVVFAMNPNANIDLETVKSAVAEIDSSAVSDVERAALEKLRADIDRILDGTGSDGPPAVDPATLEALTKRIAALRHHRLDTRISAVRHSVGTPT